MFAQAVCFPEPDFYGFNVAATSVIGEPSDAVRGDLNGDGYDDILSCDDFFSTLTLMLGSASGAFTYTDINSPAHRIFSPTGLALGDFNKDSRLDIAVANSANNQINILQNNGNGTFTKVDSISLGAGVPVSIAAGDFNNDTWLDIAVTCTGNNAFMVFEGSASNTFTQVASTTFFYGPGRISLANMNNTGGIDILVPVINGSIKIITASNGNYSVQDVVANLSPKFVEAADLNNDGFKDLVVGGANPYHGTYINYGPTYASWVQLTNRNNDGGLSIGDMDNNGIQEIITDVNVWKQNGLSGNYSPYLHTIGGDAITKTFVYDVNRDGNLDVVAMVDIGDPFMVTVYGFGNGRLDAPVWSPNPQNTSRYTGYTNDFTGDGLEDLIVLVGSPNTSVAYRKNNGDGTFGGPVSLNGQVMPTGGTNTNAFLYEDINNDGFRDFVYVNGSGSNERAYIYYGDEEDFTLIADLPTPGGGMISIADMDGDGLNDVFIGSATFGGGPNNYILRNVNNTSFVVAATVNVNISQEYLIAEDFNGNQRADLVTLDYYNNRIFTYRDSAGVFSKRDTILINTRPEFGHVADLNGDNLNDLVVFSGNSGNGFINIFMADTDTNVLFQPAISIATNNGSHKQAFLADLNGDGRIDILLNAGMSVANNNALAVVLQNSNGTWAPIQYYGGGGSNAVYVDINDDGINDVVDAGLFLKIMLGNSDGTFDAPLTYWTNNTMANTTVADFNDDGKLDVLATFSQPTNDNFIIFYNESAIQPDTIRYCDNTIATVIGGSGANFLWSNGQTTPNATYTQGTGSYTVTNFNGCVSNSGVFNVVEVQSPAQPIIATDSLRYLCGVDTFALEIDNSYARFKWSTGDSTNRIIMVSDTGAYFVTGYNLQGCATRSDTLWVRRATAPELSLVNDTLTCAPNGVAVSLVSNSYDSIRWFNNQTLASINITDSSQVFLNAFLGNCHFVSDTVAVSVYELPAPVLVYPVSDTICAGDTVSLALQNSSDYATYEWSNGSTQSSLTLTSQGDYSVSVSNNGCSTLSDTVELVVNTVSIPVLSSTGTVTLCRADTLSLSVNNSYDQYAWASGNTTATESANTAGLYYVVVTSNGCSATSDTVTVRKSTTTDPTISNSGLDTICQGQSLTLSTIAMPGGTTAWYKGTQQVASNALSYTAQATGSYFVRATDSLACTYYSDTLALFVNNIAKPVLSENGTYNLCRNDTLALSLNNSFDSYLWSTGSTGTNININTAGSYFVQGFEDGCSKYSDTLVVSKSTTADPVISYSSNTSLCENETMALSVVTVANATYRWYSNGQQLPATNSAYTATATGTYYLKLTDPLGCIYLSDSVSLTFSPLPIVALAMAADTLCTTDGLILNGGTPAGGFYTFAGDTVSNISGNDYGVGTYWVEYSYTDSNTCRNSDSLQLSIVTCVGIGNEPNETGAFIYPTLTQSSFVLHTGSVYGVHTCIIMDLAGRVVYQSDVMLQPFSNEQFDIAHLPAGTYLFKLHGSVNLLWKVIKL